MQQDINWSNYDQISWRHKTLQTHDVLMCCSRCKICKSLYAGDVAEQLAKIHKDIFASNVFETCNGAIP